MGLVTGSYEAYCFDEACWYLGVTITRELEDVGRKKDKKEASNEAMRKRVLEKYIGKPSSSKSGFADPAALFGTS